MSGSDRDIARVATRQFGLVTRRQALEGDFTASAIQRRITSGRWMIIECDVYLINGSPISWAVKLKAVCLSTGGVASHRSAAVLHGLDGFRPGRPEVTVPRGKRVRAVNARVHESLDLHLTTPVRKDGIPTTDPSRLAVDLGSVVPFDRYERAMDQMIGSNMLTWDQALDSVLTYGRRGRNGVGALRALLLERYGDEVSDSALERAFERMLRKSSLPRAVAQFNVHDDLGFVARVDYAYPEKKIAIELDSKRYHLNAVAFEADARKRNRLKLDGWLVLEYTWDMLIKQPFAVLRQIEKALGSR